MMMLLAQTERLIVKMAEMTHLTIVWPGLDDQRGLATYLQGKHLSMLH